MLLNIMSFARNIATDDSSTAQPDLCGFSLSGIGLLGFRDTDFEAYAFHLGAAAHSGGFGSASGFGTTNAAADLVEGGMGSGGGGEGAMEGGWLLFEESAWSATD